MAWAVIGDLAAAVDVVDLSSQLRHALGRDEDVVLSTPSAQCIYVRVLQEQ